MTDKKNTKPGFKDFISLRDYLAIRDYAFLFVGSILAIFTGAGIPHLVCVVGWLLDVFVMVEPASDAFRAKTTPLLLGILVGSPQLFIYVGMGLGALYGNWLIDNSLMTNPGYIFVIACSIMPAAMKFGQIHLNLKNLYRSRFALSHVQNLLQNSKSTSTVIQENSNSTVIQENPNPTVIQGNPNSTVAQENPNPTVIQEVPISTVIQENPNPTVIQEDPNSTVIQEDPNPTVIQENSESKRKTFLLKFFKNEIGNYSESFHPKNCSGFIFLRKSALKKKIYGLGFIFCLIFAAAPPTFTKLNGDLYEFYKIGRTEPFFSEAVTISWKYLVAGIITCLAGIFCTIIYARNGESIAKEVRCSVYTDFTDRHGPNLPDSVRQSMVSLVTKSANQCKSAFDVRLSNFTVGVFSLAFGVAFVFEKNVPSAFFCSVCFGIQAVAQYFVFRIADIHLKRAISEKNEKAKIGLRTFENMSDSEVGESLSEISGHHDQYLSFSFHRLSSVVVTQAFRFAFIVAVPQLTQALAYLIGCFLVVENLVRPIVLYKVVQTLYMSSLSIATIAQFNMDVHQARLGALDLNHIIGDDDTESQRSSRSGTNIIHPVRS